MKAVKNLGLWLILLVVGFSSCRKLSDPAPYSGPKTSLTLRELNYSDNQPLISRVRINWAGTTSQGFIKGYKVFYSLGPTQNVTERFAQIGEITQKTDSTFRFSLPAGDSTGTIYLYVQAVDNKGRGDANPPFLRLPIRNSRPVAEFVDRNNPQNDSVLAVLTVEFSLNDPDGVETLDSLYIKVNNGAWYPLPVATRVVTLMALNPEVDGAQQALVFRDQTLNELRERIEGFVVGSRNKVYVKTVDVGNSTSRVDSTLDYFVRRKTSDLLVMDTYSAPGPENVYLPILSTVYTPGFDRIDLMSNGRRNQFRYWSTTFKKLASLYDKIFWYSDNQRLNNVDPNSLLIETAAEALRSYLADDGKLFMTTTFPAGTGTSRIQKDSPAFSYLPVLTDSIIVIRPDSTREYSPFESTALRVLTNTAFISPAGGFDTLRNSGAFIGATPFFISKASDVRVLYRANTTDASTPPPHTGANTYAALRTNLGRTNLVFFSCELHRLQGGTNGTQRLSNVFNRVLNQEFNW